LTGLWHRSSMGAARGEMFKLDGPFVEFRRTVSTIEE
jgi:hypothetical protein